MKWIPGTLRLKKEEGNNYLLFYHQFPISVSKAEYFGDLLLDCDFRVYYFLGMSIHYPMKYNRYQKQFPKVEQRLQCVRFKKVIHRNTIQMDLLSDMQ